LNIPLRGKLPPRERVKAWFFSEKRTAQKWTALLNSAQSKMRAPLVQTIFIGTDQKKRLFSKDEMEVSVQREDGSSFTGKGFEADMKLGILRFENGVQGTLEVNDEE
jgi:hypothetical protein